MAAPLGRTRVLRRRACPKLLPGVTLPTKPLRGVLWGLNATRGLRASLPLELALADVGVPRIEHPAEDARVEEAGARKLPAIDGEASSMRGMSHARVSPVNKKIRRT